MAAQPAGPTYYALLVGIDSYPEDSGPLDSCARDVREISKCLEKNNAGTVHTTILVAAAKDNSPDSAAHPEGRPTYDNVMSGLQHITERAKEGDFVYIHYSGHGTRLPPGRRNAFSNHNTGDLAWVVLQDSKDGVQIRYLYGSHLAQRIKGMVERGLRVTLILDCCHSGSVMRDDDDDDMMNDGGARYLEYDAEVDAAFPPEVHGDEDIDDSSSTLVPLPGARRRTYRDASMLPSWMIDPHGFSVIAACGPHEIARHVRLASGAQHGRLSYFLIEVFRDSNLGGFRGQFEDIYERLRIRFLQRFPTQNPMWYGNRQHEFSGIVPMLDPASPRSGSLYPVTLQSDGRWQLEGGQAHGICIGDQLDVVELGYLAVVTEVRGLTSDLDIVSPSDVGTKKGWPARARTKFSLRKYPVQLMLGLSNDTSRCEEIQSKRPWLKILFHEHELRDPPFRVNPVSTSLAAGYEIRDESGEVFKHVGAELSDLDQALNTVEHLAKFRLFNELSNGPSPISCDVRLVNAKTGQTFRPGTIVEATHKDRLNINVNNKGFDILYVHLYNLLPCWDIKNMLMGGYDVLHPRTRPREPESVETSFKRRGRKPYKIDMEIPKELIEQGHQECMDIIKVLITKRPTSFEPWRLPKIGEAPSYEAPTLRGEDEQNTKASEQWVALTFPVHISKHSA
ncbi:caspase domain-containing protein [Hypoxylon cercidicola]|nr:caspase domain-containing protein [Hypoxylon cercidicola]